MIFLSLISLFLVIYCERGIKMVHLMLYEVGIMDLWFDN